MADNTPGRENTPRQSGLSWSQPASTARPSQTGATAGSSSSSQPKFIASPPRTTAPAQPSSRRGMLLFSSGVLVGGLLAWSWFSLSPEGAVTTNNDTNVPAAGTAATGGGSAPTPGAGAAGGAALPGSTIGSESLVVPSPQEEGLSVQITSASVSAPTWIVVYESFNGTRGNALGAALFFPENNNTNKSIKLLRATVPNRIYFVGRNVDNGDKKFSTTLDKPVTNAAGNPAYVEFRVR